MTVINKPCPFLCRTYNPYLQETFMGCQNPLSDYLSCQIDDPETILCWRACPYNVKLGAVLRGDEIP